MTVYLEEHPPARRQFYETRRAEVTAIVVHTSEFPASFGRDTATDTAHFIATRDDAGSYASVVDNERIVRVGRYEWTMFHVRGFNSGSLGLAFACQADQWATLPAEWVNPAIRNGAIEAANMARWVKATYGRDIPPVRITGEQARAGVPGFVAHGDLDPGRRTDPGLHFPSALFLATYLNELDKGPPEPMPTPIEDWQQFLVVNFGADLGTTGPHSNGIDGDFGPTTLGASKAALVVLEELAATTANQAEMAVAAEEEALRHLGTARVRIAQLEEDLSDLDDDLDREVIRKAAQYDIAADWIREVTNG